MTKNKRPQNKFERNEKKKKKRQERTVQTVERESRVRRKLYREQIKEQETEDAIREEFGSLHFSRELEGQSV